MCYWFWYCVFCYIFNVLEEKIEEIILVGSSLLILFDDIVMLLDDILVMGKLVVKKIVGVLGDDLLFNV